VRTQCAEKGVELKVVISDDLRKVVNADGHKLSRVLINLLSNAQKCTERGSILLEAASNRSSKRGDIIFSVKDSGSGISSERINDIVRGISISSEINSKQGEEGTGLGLPISVGLVSLMGGELWVESEVGRGSSFYFTIKTLNDA
jgi:signal transduction histidine kinase